MARTKHLRAVEPGEDAPPVVHERIEDALGGSPRDVLASMRLALAKKLDAGEVSSNAIASAYKELRELDRLIRAEDNAAAAAAGKAGGDGGGTRRSFNAAAI